MAYKKVNIMVEGYTPENDEMKGYCETIRQGELEIVPTWDLVDKLLEIFPDNEEWEIEELSNGMFAILPKSELMGKNQYTFQKNKLNELMAQ